MSLLAAPTACCSAAGREGGRGGCRLTSERKPGVLLVQNGRIELVRGGARWASKASAPLPGRRERPSGSGLMGRWRHRERISPVGVAPLAQASHALRPHSRTILLEGFAKHLQPQLSTSRLHGGFSTPALRDPGTKRVSMQLKGSMLLNLLLLHSTHSHHTMYPHVTAA